MQALLEHFIMQSIAYALIAVILVTFLESLILVGLIVPGTIMMLGFGTLIGGGRMNFWQAWIAGFIGCLLGDWISFWSGRNLKIKFQQWSFVKKNKELINKIKRALYQNSSITILVSRFIGPMRPLVPMIAGMLNLPITKFVVPNIFGCLFWPPIYFLPGILVGTAINVPFSEKSNSFKHLLLIIALLSILISLFWRLKCNLSSNRNSYNKHYVIYNILFWLMVFMFITLIIVLVKHPFMSIYGKLLLKVISY